LIRFKVDAQPIKTISLRNEEDRFNNIWKEIAKTVDQLHFVNNLIQGGLSLEHIVCTKEDEIYFTDWSNSCSSLDYNESGYTHREPYFKMYRNYRELEPLRYDLEALFWLFANHVNLSRKYPVSATDKMVKLANEDKDFSRKLWKEEELLTDIACIDRELDPLV